MDWFQLPKYVNACAHHEYTMKFACIHGWLHAHMQRKTGVKQFLLFHHVGSADDVQVVRSCG